MCKVIINGELFFAKSGERLSEILQKNGKKFDYFCGGLGKCKKCEVLVNGTPQLACQYVISSDITVEYDILEEDKIKESDESLAFEDDEFDFVLDIGTTTIVLAVVSHKMGKELAVKTTVNPQCAFGADVISRINYCKNSNGVEALQDVLIDEINRLIADLSIKGQIANNLFVVGNTTMLHIFFGVDPSGMGMAPYTPEFLESKTVLANLLKISGVKNIISLPSIASFVGADLVAGMNVVEIPNGDKYSILIDLGTNAEIILFNREKLVCTAAAAGPCFEGANITCGMSASDGAISSFSIENSKINLKTINNAAPRGICASGLIDIIAELLKTDEIDESGYLKIEDYVLTEKPKKISITKSDVRQYQLAKSAVCSAILSLMKLEKLGFEDIEKVYISGGFSNEINIDNAAFTGLLPLEFGEKCISIGNSSLVGAIDFALNRKIKVSLKNAKYIDLSANKDFADLFVENMLF